MHCPHNFRIHSVIFLLMISSYVSAQERPDPIFTTFNGTVYSMPIVEVKKGKLISKRIQEHYGDNIYDYKKLYNIELDELNVPETTIGAASFPGVDRSQQFCMILNSTMTIEIDGCYEFSLHSDDGSILWIDEQIVVDNDGGHQMQLRKDTFALKEGKYPVKLWYFQGMPDRFGLVFDAVLVGRHDACNQSPNSTTVELKSHLLFEEGSHILGIKAEDELSTIMDSIGQQDVLSVEVIGHTDNVGSEESNLLLSQKRADAIVSKLRGILPQDISIISIGVGERKPLKENDTSKGREMNRRVEIIIKYR